MPLPRRGYGRRWTRGVVCRRKNRRKAVRPLRRAAVADADDAVLPGAVAPPVARGREAVQEVCRSSRVVRAVHTGDGETCGCDGRTYRPRHGIRIPAPGLQSSHAAVHAWFALARRTRGNARRFQDSRASCGNMARRPRRDARRAEDAPSRERSSRPPSALRAHFRQGGQCSARFRAFAVGFSEGPVEHLDADVLSDERLHEKRMGKAEGRGELPPREAGGRRQVCMERIQRRRSRGHS